MRERAAKCLFRVGMVAAAAAAAAAAAVAVAMRPAGATAREFLY